MAWQKMTSLDGRPNPCMCCPPIPARAPLEKINAVGFGSAIATCDGELVADGENGLIFPYFPESHTPTRTEDFIRFADIEAIAQAAPDHDWRIDLFGPLHGETYQRQDIDTWLLVEKNDGFA